MKFPLPRIRDVFFLSILTAGIILGPRMLNIDSDLGRHLTLGQYMLTHCEIPLSDILSYTKNGESRPPYEWLSQILFALGYDILGLDGVILLVSLVIAIAWTLVYADSVQRSGLPLFALLLAILAAAVGSIHWLPRPHVFTFLLLVIWLKRLEHLRMGEKIRLWQFPLLMLLWANLHGGFIFGILVWLAYLAGWIVDRWLRPGSTSREVGRDLFLVGILSVAASVITPSGLGNWQAVLGNSSSYVLSQTVETMSPSFYQPELWPFLFLLGLCILLPAVSGLRLPASHALILTGFAILSLMMTRNIPLFALVVAPILATFARRLLDSAEGWIKIETRFSEIETRRRGLMWLIAGTLAIVILLSVHFVRSKQSLAQFDARVFPVSAANWLIQNPQSGNMFNEFNWGGYLLFRLWPAQRVFIDSQTDFYGERMVRDYQHIMTSQRDWHTKFEKYDVQWVIIRSSSNLAIALSHNADWKLLYRDDLTVIFGRTRP